MLRYIDILLLIVLGLPCWYFLIFSLFARLRKSVRTAEGEGKNSFTVLIPAYKSDSCIEATTQAALNQDYPKGKFRVMVISDSMQAETVGRLKAAGAQVLEVSFENSTKAKSLQAAMGSLGPGAADYVVILDADNIVEKDFLKALDGAFCNGAKAVQAHRKAKNMDTSVAVLDAAGEEINNSIYRKGHNAAGMSSALIGSGMAFSYDWFAGRIDSVTTSGEDKELELLLLKEEIYVDYLEDVPVYDEKTRSLSNYYNQRSRWTASQYNIFGSALKGLGSANDSIGYFDKLFQWLFPPRMVIVTAVPMMALLSGIFARAFFGRWILLTLVLAVAILLAIPREMLDIRLAKALAKVPSMAVMAVANLLRIRKNKDVFIHTEHL